MPSLVGSEMCIRDRQQLGQQSTKQTQLQKKKKMNKQTESDNEEEEEEDNDDDNEDDEGETSKKPKKNSEIQNKGKAKLIKVKDGSYQIDLVDSRKKVQIKKFKGKTYVDFREYYEKEGEWLHTKKGCSLTVEQWNYLLKIQDDINEAVKKI
eukprot:TRINITY_DN5841_c0_g1_i2.p2 TRINITY_DN5841_c0_g1~~TRINITY_DN5841_c0_g1_i2.p2  ORF type:complete len:152 (-),score=54.72 TRINITY_DN5841_c0_g1_i2:161-616(-)